MTDAAPKWIAIDWGTSNLRAWVFGEGDQPIAHLSSDKGMGGLAPDEFEAALMELVAAHLGDEAATPVICCGMVGARQGWIEAPYAAAPCPAPGLSKAARPPVSDRRLDVYILPGVLQADPADVMRGEETQIAGFLAARPGFDGVICLPGTHTKWVHVSAGEIVSFRTFMTGELFGLLSKHSVLRHSLTEPGWDMAAFAGAVADAISSPQHLSSRLFALRASSLLDGTPSPVSRARLSGLLLGLELAGSRAYWLGREVAVVGDTSLAHLYASALSDQGVAAICVDQDAMTLAGLKAAFAGLKESLG